MRDHAAEFLRGHDRLAWRPRAGSMVNHRALTASLIDSREFLAARRRADAEILAPAGPRIAFTGSARRTLSIGQIAGAPGRARVGLDHHVDIDGHYYPVPHRLIREQLDARITERTIELFCKGERKRCTCAAPAADGRPRSPSTCRARTGATPRGRSSALVSTRRRSGPAPPSLTSLILESRTHPEQGYRLHRHSSPGPALRSREP